MKFLIVALAFVACAYANVAELGYGYQQPANLAPAQQPQNTYIPPAHPAEQPQNTYIPPSGAEVASAPIEHPQNTYIPPSHEAQASAPIDPPQNTYIPPADEAIEGPAQDGYRYKTVRRVVYKHRA